MPNTYTSLHYHLVFATKRRERHIAPAIETRVWELRGFRETPWVIRRQSEGIRPRNLKVFWELAAKSRF